MTFDLNSKIGVQKSVYFFRVLVKTWAVTSRNWIINRLIHLKLQKIQFQTNLLLFSRILKSISLKRIFIVRDHRSVTICFLSDFLIALCIPTGCKCTFWSIYHLYNATTRGHSLAEHGWVSNTTHCEFCYHLRMQELNPSCQSVWSPKRFLRNHFNLHSLKFSL